MVRPHRDWARGGQGALGRVTRSRRAGVHRGRGPGCVVRERRPDARGAVGGLAAWARPAARQTAASYTGMRRTSTNLSAFPPRCVSEVHENCCYRARRPPARSPARPSDSPPAWPAPPPGRLMSYAPFNLVGRVHDLLPVRVRPRAEDTHTHARHGRTSVTQRCGPRALRTRGGHPTGPLPPHEGLPSRLAPIPCPACSHALRLPACRRLPRRRC